MTDPLTTMFNRRYFLGALEIELRRAGATARLSLLMIDLDYFKSVNDIYGHLFGDLVLVDRHVSGGRSASPTSPAATAATSSP